MEITLCIIALCIISVCSFHAFLQELADRAEEKRRLEAQLEKIRSFEMSQASAESLPDITVA
ncbi:MAG: hypothetical protein IJC65_03255 [Oscillospiraceae bacterium]|nr:hypothetical protein [Oscillospiraceae bacterium]